MMMPNYAHTATYLEERQNTQLKALAKARGCSVSHLLKQLIERELDQSTTAKKPALDIEDALQHIAIGVDALLKFGPGEEGFTAAKETRQLRLKGRADAR
jgi:hypothetical protein